VNVWGLFSDLLKFCGGSGMSNSIEGNWAAQTSV
jgi:hypothetical protein